jgi:hypothetical protein
MTTVTTNAELLNNLIVILENINTKINTDADLKADLNCDDFKKVIEKATDSAMNGSINIVVNKKKKASNAYTEFVKAKMIELKDQPKGSKLKFIVELWKEQKAAIAAKLLDPMDPMDPMDIDETPVEKQLVKKTGRKLKKPVVSDA